MVTTRQARRRASWRSREPRSGTTDRLGGGGRQVWLLRGGVSCWVFLMVRVRPVSSLTPAPRLVTQTVARTGNISSPRAPLRLTLLLLTPDGDTLGIREGSAFVLFPLEFERTLDRTAQPTPSTRAQRHLALPSDSRRHPGPTLQGGRLRPEVPTCPRLAARAGGPDRDPVDLRASCPLLPPAHSPRGCKCVCRAGQPPRAAPAPAPRLPKWSFLGPPNSGKCGSDSSASSVCLALL